MTEFKGWPKIARLNRDAILTEKIDGTNACVIIEENEGLVTVAAQSRNRIVTPDKDNYGFARWVEDNAETLVNDLGPGYHYGEWWGKGIQRQYGQTERFFSLFNVVRWNQGSGYFSTRQLRTVPMLYTGLFTMLSIDHALHTLKRWGSTAATGFQEPEGIIIYHTAAKQLFKVTLEGDANGKT